MIVYFIDKDMYPTKDICDVLKIKVGTKLNMCKQVKETVMIVNYSKMCNSTWRKLTIYQEQDFILNGTYYPLSY